MRARVAKVLHFLWECLYVIVVGAAIVAPMVLGLIVVLWLMKNLPIFGG
ncbi:MAG: hypothetical protein M3391_09210 [Actinomycetota bacterium]|nr:hypothetical protein [Actinomycetota bacterium]